MLKKILVADDVMTVVAMVKYILEEDGYTVITAADGVEAVEKVYKEMPDLIVIDLLMPKMNGYQVCRLLKNDVLTSHIPIIILTSESKPIDKFWAMQTGADEYLLKDLIKDYKSPELIKTVRTLLQLNIKSKNKQIPEIDIDQTNIFTRVNDLLDKKLLEATVLNEISYLGRSIYDQEKTMDSIISLLQKIIKFEIGLIFLGEEKKMLVYTKGKQSNDAQDMAIAKAIIHFNELMGLNILKDEVVVKVVEGEDGSSLPTLSKNLNSFLFSELSTRDSIMGVLLMGSFHDDAYTERDKKLLTAIVNQTSIVMDNTRLYHKVEALSITDELTKFFNKRHLAQILPQELNRTERYNRVFSLIMFDIDFFKKVNDTYGHLQGDIILREVAKIARQEIRKGDIPFRYGGEEFMIILPEADLDAAKNIAERIRKAVEKFPFPGQKDPLHISISLGVGICTKELIDEGGKKLIASVDAALYEAKKTGRNRVCIAKGTVL